MLTRILIACATLPLIAVTAYAQDIPAQQKACLDSAFALAQTAAAKNLPEERLAELESKISNLENLCDAKDYETASKTAKELETEIAGS